MTLPTHASELTASWLTDILRSAGYDAEIGSVTTEAVGTGQMAGSYRLTLAYRGGPTDLPTTMIAKLAVGDLDQRKFAAGVFRNEVRFYRDFAHLVTIPVPRCYASAASNDHTEFVLLLEDLAPAVQGDQIVGCTPEQARSVAIAAAGLHAPTWCDTTLFDADGYAPTSHDDRLLMESVLGPMTEAFRDRFTLDATENATLDWLVATAGDWLEATPNRFALTHGDLRIDNVLVAPDGTVTVVDWQTVTPGHPLRDIAFLLATSLTVPDRRAHERGIVADYHTALRRHGVTGYSAEQCWTDYVGSQLQAPLVIVFGCGAAMPTARGDAMFATMLARSAAAIDDLRARGATSKTSD